MSELYDNLSATHGFKRSLQSSPILDGYIRAILPVSLRSSPSAS